jgi:hypothetical protein
MRPVSVRFVLLVAILVALGAAGRLPAWAAPDDGILPVDQYTSDKARRLATTHAQALRELSATVYHCLPWLEVQKHSIGFFRPKGAAQDERYLAMRVYVDQEPSPAFTRMSREERIAAMFSRYVAPLLRRMTADRRLLADAQVDGFTVIVEWLKPAPRGAADRPVHETLAVFIPKAVAADYLHGRLPIGQLSARSRILAWDGEAALGELSLEAWEDDFVATYKVAHYELAQGITCRP